MLKIKYFTTFSVKSKMNRILKLLNSLLLMQYLSCFDYLNMK